MKNEIREAEDFFKEAAELQQADTVVNNSQNEMWIDASSDGFDGQLAVDVFQDDTNLYVKAIVGGSRPEDIEVHLNNDLLTIKGKRVHSETEMLPEQYYIQECYWGGFSRSIILPVDVLNDQVEANIVDGVLSIRLPKSKRPKNTRIPIKQLD
ncbi:MAG: Hsp20/alpha crystallin family protein [Candidatus Kerfeldbacteria bacterium]|nr:Hsp20/alpha crystallin family protein [Candidatus Kerfeldbacteria bacterium]